MKVVGIIAEYNPMHNGHVYHIQKAKEVTNSNYSIVIMSGSFTQNGNIAIYDKFERAKIATEYGADLVIELPTIYSVSSARYFAFGAVNILNKLNIVDSICFGSECDNIEILNNISDIILQNENKIWEEINIYLKSGISFANARIKALSKFLNDEQLLILDKPNNILGLEYINEIKRQKSNIKPFLIKRECSCFNELNLNKNSKFTSATSIREAINKNNIECIKQYVPNSTYKLIENKKPTFNQNLFDILKFKIISSNIQDIRNISEVTEGLENKIFKEINNSNNYDKFVKNIKSKRYQLSKIKRMLVNVLLNITKDDLNYVLENKVGYVHVLSCSKKGKELLSMISNNSNIDLITSLNDKIINNISNDTKKFLEYDILASNIYSILSNDKIQKDYTNRL